MLSIPLDPASPPGLRFKIALAFATASLVYGAIYLGIKVTVDNRLPPISSCGVRYVLAGGALLASLRARGTPVRLPGPALARSALLGGMLLAPFGLIALAERDISSGLASLLFASTPLVVVALRIAMEHVENWPILAAGSIAGFGGVAVIALANGEQPRGTVLGMACVLASALIVGMGTFAAPRLDVGASPFTSAGWQLISAGALLVALGALAGDWLRYPPSAFGLDGLIAFVILAAVGTIPPYVSYVWLLGHVATSKVAATAYINPLVAVVLGWVVLDERVGLPTLVGGAIIVLSVAVVLTRER